MSDMKTNQRMKAAHAGLLVLLSLLAVNRANAQYPEIRLSFKFILDASGNRPATGNVNTVAEIDEQVAKGSTIFAALFHEFRLVKTEVVDVSGHSSWYSATMTDANRNALRNAAIADPTGYAWRTNAVNVYILGGSDTGISDFPPNNDIIMIAQSIFDTTVAHEAGHIMNLYHTHQDGGADQCADTISDNEDWTKDQIAMNNFGNNYAMLTPAQQAQVDLVWGNLMSYHDPDNRSLLSFCQKDRDSSQGYFDRARLLTRDPIYVRSSFTGTPAGSFVTPFQTIQQAINAGVLPGRPMILEQGTYARPTGTMNPANSAIITRNGVSTIQEAPPAYNLPYSVQDSENPAVRAAALRALEADKHDDFAGVIANLIEAEKNAEGREKTAIQLELAQRNRSAKRWMEAEQWFRAVAASADQEPLRKHALKRATVIKEERAKIDAATKK
jgi:hypothetical protein